MQIGLRLDLEVPYGIGRSGSSGILQISRVVLFTVFYFNHYLYTSAFMLLSIQILIIDCSPRGADKPKFCPYLPPCHTPQHSET